MNHVFDGKIALAILLAGSCGACALIDAVHRPLYRAEPHTSTISVRARSFQVGISSITVYVTTGTMTDCPRVIGPGLEIPSIIPCRVDAVRTEHTCRFLGNPADATCQVSLAVTDRMMVSYHTTARLATGWEFDTPEIAYAGGQPPSARIARPVYWHMLDSRDRHVDIGIFPDADYGANYRLFTDDLDRIGRDVFFNETDAFAREYSFYIGAFNLWAGPFGADGGPGSPCTRDFSGASSSANAVMDASVIFHRNPFRDCSSFTVAGGGGASGTVETTETNPGPLFVHESGHFLFALVDEYCCNGGYRTDLPCPNLYESQTACQSAAPAVGASTAQCTQINAQGGRVFWRISSAQETMDQQGLNTDFRDDSRACVRRYLEACKTGGSCF